MQYLFDSRKGGEGSSTPHHQISSLTCFNRSNLLIDPEQLGRVLCDQSQRHRRINSVSDRQHHLTGKTLFTPQILGAQRHLDSGSDQISQGVESRFAALVGSREDAAGYVKHRPEDHVHSTAGKQVDPLPRLDRIFQGEADTKLSTETKCRLDIGTGTSLDSQRDLPRQHTRKNTGSTRTGSIRTAGSDPFGSQERIVKRLPEDPRHTHARIRSSGVDRNIGTEGTAIATPIAVGVAPENPLHRSGTEISGGEWATSLHQRSSRTDHRRGIGADVDGGHSLFEQSIEIIGSLIDGIEYLEVWDHLTRLLVDDSTGRRDTCSLVATERSSEQFVDRIVWVRVVIGPATVQTHLIGNMKSHGRTGSTAGTDIATVKVLFESHRPEDLQTRILSRKIDRIGDVDPGVRIDQSRSDVGNFQQVDTLESGAIGRDTHDDAILDLDQSILEDPAIADMSPLRTDRHIPENLCGCDRVFSRRCQHCCRSEDCRPPCDGEPH